jgi:sugar phosphate isomerase/epimerase
MRIGFRAEGTDAQFKLAKKVGMPVIELGWYPEVRAEIEAVEKRAKDYNIGISALLTGEEFDLAGLKHALDWTKRLGAFAFVTHPHPIKPDDKAAIAAFTKLFEPAAAYAKTLGVDIAVHSCGLDPESWDTMFRAVPDVKLKYDPSFSLEAGRNYLGEIIKYRDRIVHFHIKDEICLGRTTDFTNGIMPYQYVPAGMGDIKWGSVIALLLEGGYKYDLAVETHSSFWWQNQEWDLTLCKRHIEQFLP